MREATGTDAVSEFVQQVLAGTGWELRGVRKRASRVEPPQAYWVSLEATINKEEEERKLRLVARGAFDPGAWEQLRQQLINQGGGHPTDPISSIGYPTIVDESQVAYWIFPFDLAMPGLPTACDAEAMWHLLSSLRGGLVGEPLQIERLHVERVRYTPEISAIMRYKLDGPDGVQSEIYGKVQPGNRGRRTFDLETSLWQSACESDGLLRMPRPLAFVRELGLFLETGVPGTPVKGDRESDEFRGVGVAAGEALAVIHESGLQPDETIYLDRELERLADVAKQFAYTDPKAHFLLNELLVHLHDRVERSFAEEMVPTHADLKYDQFLHDHGTYSLIDYDYFAMAETSYDLGKFCAYLFPSAPRSWEDANHAEAVRLDFLRRYRELRPYATLDRFQIYEAVVLALRAMTMMWMQQRGWQQAAEVFLVMAQERLNSRLPDLD